MFNFNLKNKFKNVVLIEYPSDRIWSIAFQINNTNNELYLADGSDDAHISVFLPNDTNCKSGKLLMIHKDKVSKTNFTIQEGLNLMKNLGINEEIIKPTIYQIKTARNNSGLTQEGAANLIYSSISDWNDWERGYSIMPYPLFELFLFKTSQKIEKHSETATLRNYEIK